MRSAHECDSVIQVEVCARAKTLSSIDTSVRSIYCGNIDHVFAALKIMCQIHYQNIAVIMIKVYINIL